MPLPLPPQGEWGVTAEQEAEEKRRVQEFQGTIPKMRSQLQILTHFYQVGGGSGPGFLFPDGPVSSDPVCAPQSIVQQFLVLLTTSPDESLRFLSFRLDFNEHYRSVRRRRRRSSNPNPPPSTCSTDTNRKCRREPKNQRLLYSNCFFSVFLNQRRGEPGSR